VASLLSNIKRARGLVVLASRCAALQPRSNVYYQPHRSYRFIHIAYRNTLGFDDPCTGGIKAEVAFAPADSSLTPLSPTSVCLLSVLTAEVTAASAVMHWRRAIWIFCMQQKLSLPSRLCLCYFARHIFHPRCCGCKINSVEMVDVQG
jgi:hypothetical protein